MLGVAKPALATSALTIVRRLSQVKSTVLRCAQRSAMSDSLASKSLLDAQSFGGDQLNRSVGDRRDENFVQTAFQGSTSLLISGRSVLAKRRPGVSNDSPQSTELCWLSPEDLHDFGIEAQTDSQTTVAGKRSSFACKVQVSAAALHCWYMLCRSGERLSGTILAWPDTATAVVFCFRCFCLWQPKTAASSCRT